MQVEQPITLLTRFLEGSLLGDSSVDHAMPTTVSLNKAPDLSHALFIISGFSAFSTQEQQLIQVLMKRSHVVIDLILDRGYPQEMPTPLNLFYEAGRTYYQLISSARDNQVNIYLDQKLSVNQEVDKEDEGSIPQAYKEVETFGGRPNHKPIIISRRPSKTSWLSGKLGIPKKRFVKSQRRSAG